jgi:signal transduction histidine kinase
LAGVFAIGAALVLQLHVLSGPMPRDLSDAASTALALVALLPSAVLIYMVQRFNFLQIGRQKNLVYAVSATFLALLYLSLVRRLSGWMAPEIPPEATASILLFVLVIFFEPLQRLLGRRLQETAQKEMDVAHRLAAEIQQQARRGDLPQLNRFVEKRLKEQFELGDVELVIFETNLADRAASSQRRKRLKAKFPIIQEGREEGELSVEPHGALVSGETQAALEFLCGQLPGALDLCRLIDEKVRLERELAERERLALLGQMAASISHNLKNPLGSIKTILQVQMENPELPESLRGETQIVLDEIGRLSSKLNQLLRFSRPAVRGGSVEGSCDVAAVIEEVAGVLRHEAERRGVTL